MKQFRRDALVIATLAVALVASSPRVSTPAAAAAVSEDNRLVIHVLNRIGFGPRWAEVEKVQALGLQNYIDLQLHPQRIPDSEMNARLTGLPTVGMSSREIAERYERPALDARRQRKDDKPADVSAGELPRMPDPLQQNANTVLIELAKQKILRAVYSERQLEEVLTDFWFNHFNVDARKGPDRFMLTEYERETIRPHVLGNFRNLLEATAKSPSMLFYLDN